MIERIKELEKVARQLEPDEGQRESMTTRVVNHANAFLSRMPEAPAYFMSEDKGRALYDHPITEEPTDLQLLLELVDRHVERQGINPGSAGHLAYIPGGPLYPSALGDFLAAVNNCFDGHFYGGPGAVRMENLLLRWIADVVAYPAEAAGNLTSGGSMANLIGFVTAREAFQMRAKDVARSVVYLTNQAHHSVIKSLHVVGLRECIKRTVPTDDHHRMVTDELERLIRQDSNAGLRPWLVVAAAGSTDTGAVDPLEQIARVSEKYQLWFHIDAAYGGFFTLCEEGKKVLRGMERSDSIVMDPHKGLFLPFGTGALLVKDGAKLFAAHRFEASYNQDTYQEMEELSPTDLSPELSRHFRGLRLWLPLKLFGTRPFKAALEEKLLLARYFRNRLMEIEGFEVGPPPDLSIVTFRYIPKAGDPEPFNQRLLRLIHEDGRVFMSSTTVNNTFVIRLAVLGFRTHIDTIDKAIDILQEKVNILLAE
jgi:glutamate/tyrosine decarboxylase-like PLP-dependent enzyme